MIASAAAALFAAVSASAPCRAGTIRDDRLDSQYRSYAAQPQFSSVGSYSTGGWFGSFTLISPQWGLTAAHVVDTNHDGSILDESVTNDTLTIGSQSHHPTQVIVPLGINGNPGWNGDINHGFDLALVHLDQPFSGIQPAQIYTGFQELGKQITSVGYGQGGTGKTGATTGVGTKRAGDNVVDQFATFANGATALRWDFDEPAPRTSPNYSGSSQPLDLEYLIGPGDSGGGSFLYDNGDWYLAGVHSGTYDLYNYPGATSNTSTYGDGALATRVAAYQDFIFGNIPELASAAVPEPASVLGLVIASTPLVLLRRRRRGRNRSLEHRS